jgi:hypothetical protein
MLTSSSQDFDRVVSLFALLRVRFAVPGWVFAGEFALSDAGVFPVLDDVAGGLVWCRDMSPRGLIYFSLADISELFYRCLGSVCPS